jgi:hypothetical protein
MKRLLWPLRGILYATACNCWRTKGIGGPAGDYTHHAHWCRVARMARWLGRDITADNAHGWITPR